MCSLLHRGLLQLRWVEPRGGWEEGKITVSLVFTNRSFCGGERCDVSYHGQQPFFERHNWPIIAQDFGWWSHLLEKCFACWQTCLVLFASFKFREKNQVQLTLRKKVSNSEHLNWFLLWPLPIEVKFAKKYSRWWSNQHRTTRQMWRELVYFMSL